MRDVIAADVGNGFGCVALVEEEGRDAVSMLPADARGFNPNEGMPTEAYVTPPKGEPILVCDPGKGPAGRRIRRDPAHAVRAIKTRLRQEALDLPGIEPAVSPYAVYGAAARDLMRLANRQRAADGREPVYRLVLTYPAAFVQYEDALALLNRMQAAVEAQEVDGRRLQVVGRLPEPGAVAIDYLYYRQHCLPEGERLAAESYTVLVYDLGYGTFDTAVATARSRGEPYEVYAADGLPDVGGKDFDERLLQEVLERLAAEDYAPQDEQEREELLREVVEAKHELSREEETVLRHLDRRSARYREIPLTRARFEEITRDLLLQTVECAQRLLHEQTRRGRQIDAVVLSGGASQMPMVRRALQTLLEPRLAVEPPFRPSRAVAFGAARYAFSLPEEESAAPEPEPVARLYTPHPYGVLLEEESLEGRVRLLIPREAPLPATAELPDFCRGGRRVDVRVFRPRKTDGAAQSLPPAQCENLVFLHFDLPPGRYSLRLTVERDLNLSAQLVGPGGDVYSAGTVRLNIE